MSAPALTLITYVWHYVVARLLYDQLVRPLSRGHVSVALLICCLAAVAFLAGRRRARRRPRAADRREL